MLHKSGNVDVIYMKWAAAGDQFTGRTLCGLPLQSPDFVVLTPHFIYTEEWARSAVDAVMKDCFALSLSTRDYAYPVLKMCFASIIYHKEWLYANLPSNSVVRKLSVFTHGIADKLAAVVHSGRISPVMKATGIPANALFLGEFERVRSKLEDVVQRFNSDEIRSQIGAAVHDVMERYADERGQITPHES